MADSEDYLDGLLDRVSKVRDNMDSGRRGSRRERSGRRRRVSTEDDYMEARGLRGGSDRDRRRGSRRSRRSKNSDEDRFLDDFEKDLFGGMDDDFGEGSDLGDTADFLRELDSAFEGEDSLDLDFSDAPDVGDILSGGADEDTEDAAGAGEDDLLSGIADIVSEAKGMTDAPEPSAAEPSQAGEAVPEDPLGDIPDEPDLSAAAGAAEAPLMDEEGADVDLMDLLNSEDGDGDLSDIGDLLNADASDSELDESRDSFEAGAEDAKEGGAGVEGAEKAQGDGTKKEGEAGEKKPGFFARMMGALLKRDDEDEEGEEEEEEEEEEGDQKVETPEEKKARKKAEKEEKKKKKKEEADAKKKEKEAAKKEKEAKKKEKAAAKAKAKAKRKKKKKDTSPKIPLPGILVFVVFGLSLVALSQVSVSLISYTSTIKRAEDNFDKENYLEAYRLVEGIELKEVDTSLRDKAKSLGFLQLKYQQYQACLKLGKNQMALDSLICGVNYYQKNKKAANKLGISELYDAQGTVLTKELQDAFDLSPEDAVDVYSLPTRKKYTGKLQDILEAVGMEVDP